MPATRTSGVSVNEVRQELCRHIARKMRRGALRFQVRIVKPNEEPHDAWLYVHQEHEWRKQSDVRFAPEWLAMLEEQLRQIASHEHTDDWTARCRKFSDRVDFDIQFQREVIEEHPHDKLASYLLGSLFERSRDSEKDARRSIRPPTAVRVARP